MTRFLPVDTIAGLWLSICVTMTCRPHDGFDAAHAELTAADACEPHRRRGGSQRVHVWSVASCGTQIEKEVDHGHCSYQTLEA